MLKLNHILKFILQNMSEKHFPPATEAEYFPETPKTEDKKESLADLIKTSLEDNKLDKEEIENIKKSYEIEKYDISEKTKKDLFKLKDSLQKQISVEENKETKKSLIELDDVLKMKKDPKSYLE